MIIPNQMVEVHWCPANKTHYEFLGYKYTGCRDSLMVKAEHLLPKSTIKVQVQCDYCGEVYVTTFKSYLLSIESNNKACCKKCWNEKVKETMQKRYSINNPFESEETQEKIKSTIVSKYGCENVGQSEEIKRKIAQTNLNKYGNTSALAADSIRQKCIDTIRMRYGVDNVFASEQIKDKIKYTLKDKYGVDNPSYIQEVLQKREDTSMRKRGVSCPFQDPEVIAKCRQSLMKNGNVSTSKPEKQLCEMLIKIYGEDNCVAGYAYDRVNFDCLVKIQENLIDVEYDGWYWHENKQEEDKRRNYFLIRKGFKVLRFQANKEIPTISQIKDAIDYLVKDNHSLCIVKLDI